MTMDIKALIAPAPDWTGQTWAARLDQAASLLFLHGYIPQSVREKITLKLNKQFSDAIATGEIVECVKSDPSSLSPGYNPNGECG